MDLTRLGPEAGARCLVLGGCGGIGRAYVSGLLAASARVAVLDLPASIEAFPVPEGVEGVAVDATDEAALGSAIGRIGESWGGIDVFAFLTGMNVTRRPLAEMPMSDIRKVLEINLISAFTATQAALPYLKRSANASAVYVASGLHAFVEPGFSAYSASKGGLVSLMKVVAKEGAPHLRANAVAPGAVDTAFLTGGLGHGGQEGEPGAFLKQFGTEKAGQLLSSIPLGRIAEPDDVAGPMLFLSGPASRYLTGQVIYVNGGRFAP
ncbi:SDR family oxidoreductase [Acetobacteraceae bacterium H6797]|nr:SDR family oxidoreductase [Acetobacteraceae bacterium H6797]